MSPSSNAAPLAAVHALRSDLSKFSSAFLADLDRLAAMLTPAPRGKEDDLRGYGDPADPRNKSGKNLSQRGIEVIYRMFDEGKNRFQVKEAMDISYGGASNRWNLWKEAGGPNRVKAVLEP